MGRGHRPIRPLYDFEEGTPKFTCFANYSYPKNHDKMNKQGFISKPETCYHNQVTQCDLVMLLFIIFMYHIYCSCKNNGVELQKARNNQLNILNEANVLGSITPSTS